jgi:hypothetical protein
MFVPVEKYPKAILVSDVKSDWFSCLITSDHNIKIGNKRFWDWDDYLIK